MPAFSDDEILLMDQAMWQGIGTSPDDYFKLKTGFAGDTARETLFDPFRATPKDQLTTEQLATIVECMKLSVMFVADWEYHARTGFHKQDAVAFIVAMETTGRPPQKYPKGLRDPRPAPPVPRHHSHKP